MERAILLNDFSHSEFSQSGEDGILAKLFSEIGVSTGFFVEFGAWDGQHLSNTHRLIGEDWSGCLIEGDRQRYQDLQTNIPSDQIVKVSRYVALSGPDSLDAILDSVAVAPRDFDLLSIDIDSDDLAIWESLTDYRPKCVIIEYNPTIPLDVIFRNQPGQNQGNSASAIDLFANGAGYVLVAFTGTNLVYLDRVIWSGSRIKELTLSDLTVGKRYFFGYDGTLFVQRGDECTAPEVVSVPWTTTAFPQPIPRFIRQFDRLNGLKMLLSGVAIAVTRPGLLPQVAARVWKRFNRSSE